MDSPVPMEGRNCVGRQPAVMYITPSKPNIWYGRIIDDRRFTEQQSAKLIELGRDPVTAEAIEVKRNATDREYYWNTRDLPPYFQMMCPVVARRADGKIKVIAPSGAATFVRSDGWAGAPGRIRRRF